MRAPTSSKYQALPRATVNDQIVPVCHAAGAASAVGDANSNSCWTRKNVVIAVK
jgi:hypothetical protein